MMNSKTLKILSQSMVMTMLVALLSGTVLSVNAAPGDITRVSVDSSGAQANGSSRHEQISGDDRYVVFESDATNLAGGTGGLFLKDRQTGAVTRVGVDGEAASISHDGRFIAFDSGADNEVSGDMNGSFDIFVFDRQSGLTTRASIDSGGTEANGDSTGAAISGDGRFVAFPSDAFNLVSDDTNNVGDVFLHDRQTGTTERISITNDGTQANSRSFDVSISADGRIVVFSSNATNLVSNDTNGKTDIFARDRQTGTTTRVSVNSSGVQADRGAIEAFVSANGRYVSFASAAENLMSQPPLEFQHVFVHDRQTGMTTLASSYSDGNQMIGDSEGPVISADGRYVAFVFDDKGDSLPFLDIYVHDSLTGATISAPGGQGHSSFEPSISADGSHLAYWTDDSLVAGDTNGTNDIFVYEPAFVLDLIPTVVSVLHDCPNGCGGPADQMVDFLVKFSETVTGVDASDFVLTTGGGISGAAVSNVSGAGSDFIVRVDTGTGDGTLRLDIADNDSIMDPALNPLGGAGVGNGSFTTGEVYMVDKSLVAVTSILRVDPNPTVSGSVHFSVNFSEPVTGVDLSDFSPVATGTISGVVVMEVNGSGNTYTVTVNTGIGDGTLGLNVLDDGSILDASNVPLGGVGLGTGNFTTGEVYAIDRSTPSVVNILRTDPNPTLAAAVHFSVTFSEPASGVDGSDFLLTISGVAGAVITEISVSGNTYFVTVSTGAGNGSIRLDVLDNDSIVDASGFALGGAGIGNGSFNIGESYTINKIAYISMTEKLRSTGASDGWVLETSQASGMGGSKNSNAATFTLGDDNRNRQYRSILNFPTFYLPDNAVVTRAILTIKAQGMSGTDPFTTHGNILVDISTGPFGNFGPFKIKALQISDFQAPSSMNSGAVVQNNPVGGWYWTTLDGSALQYINLTGITQMRLAFQLAANGDFGNDTLLFYSGDYVGQRDRPHLLIEYTVPRW